MPQFDLLSDTQVASPQEFDLLSDTVVAPPMEFDLLSDTLVLPASAFALTSDTLVANPNEPVTKTLAYTSDTTVAFFDPHRVRTRKPRVVPEPEGCVGCGAAIDCLEVGPYDLYSLEGLPFSVILNCPSGADCTHPDQVRIICCKQLLIANIPANSTATESIKIIQDLLQDCARRQQFCQGGDCPPGEICDGDDDGCPEGVNCDDPCALFIVPRPSNCGPLQLFWNKPQSCTAKCPDGLPFTYTIKAGVFLALSQVLADKQAKARACVLAKEGRICLAAASETACADEALEMRINASGAITNNGVVTLFWDVDSSTLPPGMSLSQPAFKRYALITGTPTTPGTYTFTVSATNQFTGATQSRSYTITIQSCPADVGNVEPSILSGTSSVWNSDVPLLAGHYRVSYVNGAWRPGPADQWVVGDGGGTPARGYVIVHSGGTELDYPTTGIYNTQAEAEAATLGTSISFYHTGGKIAIYLRDSPYGDNHAGSPNPIFNLRRL